MQPWRVHGRDLLLDIRVTPKSGRDAIGQISLSADGQAVLKIHVRAAPTEGEANAAVGALLAKALGVPKSAVALERGAAARVKTMRISGDAARMAAALEAIAATKRSGK